MNKIINGRRYDTERAKKVAEWYNGQYGSFHYVGEQLFRKQTGEFFLYGEGGPMTKYAKAIGQNEWSGGERIMPLSLEDAQKWAEDHLDADEYEEIFGATEDTSAKRTVTFSLTEATIEKISRLAVEKDITKSEVIESLLK
jgi:hypothetical protein